MVEPTLPTSAAIAAFVMTVISWYGMLRTGVQLIHNEIKDSKSYKRDIKEMVNELDRQNRKLERWKKQWLFWKGTPDSLHLHFWGEAEYKTIKIKLKSMIAHFIEGERELHRFSTLTETRWNAMRRTKRKMLKRRFIWMKKKYLQELLEKMAKTSTDLDDAAKDGWCHDRQYDRNNVDFAYVHRIGIGHLLVPIAMQTHNYTDTLWQCCNFARESFTTELDLDIFGASLVDSRDEYLEAITKAAANQHATLTLLTRDALLRIAEMTRVCIKKSAASTEDNVAALVDALSSVTKGSEECHFMARSDSSDLAFSVCKSSQYFRPGTGMRKSFREIQSTNLPPKFTNRALLGSISKFRIAFELAQACLLFLRTTWFSEICTCGIRCGRPTDESDELQYDFTLQLGEVEHQPAQWAGTQIRGCWGQIQRNWDALTKPMRRLGLLLIEVTLGTTILETECDVNGAIISITFVEEDERGELRKKRHRLDHVLENIRIAAHDRNSYEEAIKHCATAHFPQCPDDAQMKDLLAKFYWDVVDPQG